MNGVKYLREIIYTLSRNSLEKQFRIF